MAVRSVMHRAGAAALTELLRFPPPAVDQRTILVLAVDKLITGNCDPSRSDRGGLGGSVASLLPMLALSQRPISRRCRTGYRKHGVLAWGAPDGGCGGPRGGLRPRTPADETTCRSGCDHQSRGANGGGDWGRYRRARAGGDASGHAVGSADGHGQSGSYLLCANGWDRNTGGEERDGGPARQDGRSAIAYAGSEAGMRLHADCVGQRGLPYPRSEFHHLHGRYRDG